METLSVLPDGRIALCKMVHGTEITLVFQAKECPETLNKVTSQIMAAYAERKEKPFFGELVEFVVSAPVIIMALHKEDAINDWRKLIGATDPAKADAGTVRNLYGSNIGNNAVHGSLDSASAATDPDGRA